ncbi:MAG: lysylphosphatidylglycerol synthase transmembrane domain-containing protein, partial [Acidobacteriota bacterium]
MVTDQPSGATRARSALIPIAKAAVSIVLLWILFSRVDLARLWAVARHASVPRLVAALGLYLAMIVTSAWRWDLLLKAQGLVFPFARLVTSFLVATFFNNFLPSNIGGDVIRISDTAPAAGSKTLATTVVLLDRGLGLLGLVLVAAMGASAGPGFARSTGGLGAGMLWAGFGLAAMIATPALLMPNGLAALLKPLRVLHPEWVDERIGRITAALARFRESPGALGGGVAGAVAVQGLLVGFYLAVAHSMSMPINFAALAVIVPISFI